VAVASRLQTEHELLRTFDSYYSYAQTDGAVSDPVLDTYLSSGVQLLHSVTTDLDALAVLDESPINLFDLGYQQCPDLDERGQRCQSKECRECSIIEYCQIAHCIQASAPTHHLGISNVDRGSMKEFVRTVRETDESFAYIWSEEINRRQTMIHCHGYFHASDDGKKITNQVIDKARRKAGLGTFKKSKIWEGATPRFFAYPGKTLGVARLRESFLDLNGLPGQRKLVHATRGAWRDGAHGPSMSRKKLYSILRRRRAGATIRHVNLAEIAKRIREAA
jgi:hypothetical protein